MLGLNVAKELLGLLPSMLRAASDVAEFFEVPGCGPQKRAAAQQAMRASYDAAAHMCPSLRVVVGPEAFDEMAGVAIDSAVAFHNLTGAFDHADMMDEDDADEPEL